jgi:uncharacterized coiled-coil protein SlyX
MKDIKKNTKTQPSTGTQEINLDEIKQDLAEMKETLKKIEQLIALLVDILPYKR